MAELNKNMSVEEFDNSYFYAKELKAFAKTLEITVGSLKKNELEVHIRAYLSGDKEPELPKSVPNRKTKGRRDTLKLGQRIVNYVSDKKTKDFLILEIEKKDSQIGNKSGQWYWLNAWRKKQVLTQTPITYDDLVSKLYELMTTPGRLPQIPSTRFNNFITDFLADSANRGKTKTDAVKQWGLLKQKSIPKTYSDYKLNIDLFKGVK